jgi:hypothetical protein
MITAMAIVGSGSIRLYHVRAAPGQRLRCVSAARPPWLGGPPAPRYRPVMASPAAAGLPARPASVPEGATWFGDAGEWRDGAVDARGDKQGLHRSWRRDGTLREEVAFVDGKAEGRYRRYHPSGAVAREGSFQAGGLQGTLRTIACDDAGSEPLQPCCVPLNAWELHTDYDRGEAIARRWYDRHGTQILENGDPHPPRPASVPDDARFDESAALWFVGRFNADGEPVGLWRRWSLDGALVEEEEWAGRARHGVWRRYGDRGALRVEARYADGRRDGPYRDLGLDGAAYRDARAASEEGAFQRDQPVGPWTLRDAAGAVIAARDLGAGVDEDGLASSPALADGGARDAVAAARFADLSRALAGEGRLGEAIAAMARAAAAAGDAAPLRALLDAATWPRATAAARAVAQAAIEAAGGALAPLLAALVHGGDAADLLRALGSSLSGKPRAALDLVDAALLLAPERSAYRVTRAIALVQLGAPERARADLALLPVDQEAQRDLILDYVRVIFARFDFLPARTPIATLFEEHPVAPAQPPEAIRALAATYATRLGSVRAALVELAGAPAPDLAWLPPDLSALLPDGPVALDSFTFEQTTPGEGPDDPAETETITVDERPPLSAPSIPTLLRVARADWAALAWLCWSCGLDRIARPEAVEPPADFGRAAGMAVERAWRCHDKLTSGGLVALGKGVPGFEWEGMAIDLMPRILVEILAEEQNAVRAVFLWLCDPTARSPFQSDLRDDGD